METLLLIGIGSLLLLGIIGCIIPIIPGLPISYIGLLMFHFFSSYSIDDNLLLFMAFVVIAVTIFDLWVQFHLVQKFGGKKKAVNGSVIGLILGVLFFPPVGLIIGPFLGAFIGARAEENSGTYKAIKIALGALLGFFVGIIFKLSVSLYIICIIFKAIPITC
jgi:uncharacterized protein YqgC (DUF456 family)|tara:strand:+ start:1953 stop:2441 length:489 start_codon:yes stop_codon:yes gene_type:complete